MGLTHVRYAADEEVPWDPGLFLLDVSTGAVEGWVRSLAALPEEERETARRASDDIAVSPSNRFVSWAGQGTLHDRHTGRTYAWDRGSIEFDRWWGTGPDERLLFRLASSGAFVAMDAGMRPVARFTLPPGERFTSPNGGYILVRECVECEPGDRFHLVHLENEANPEVLSWVLPWKTVRYRKSGGIPYRIDLLDDLVVFVADTGSGTCRVVRYDLGGALLSDSTIPCWHPWPVSSGGVGLPRISPDGHLVAGATSGYRAEAGYGDLPAIAAVSVFDAVTGGEAVRVKSASAPWFEIGLTDVWLADSSGIVVGTHRDPRIVTTDGAWKQAPDPWIRALGRPAPDDPDLFVAYDSAILATQPVVVNQRVEVQARLSFGRPSAPIPEYPDAALILYERADWGAASTALRVRTVFFHTQEPDGGYAPPPLAPVIERPPFDDRLLVEVVVDTCLNLREEHALDASILACLPNGAVAENVPTDYYVMELAERPGCTSARTTASRAGRARSTCAGTPTACGSRSSGRAPPPFPRRPAEPFRRTRR